MENMRKAKFVWVEDYYYSHWHLTAFGDEEDYEIAPGFVMPPEFVQSWLDARKAVQSLEEVLVLQNRLEDIKSQLKTEKE